MNASWPLSDRGGGLCGRQLWPGASHWPDFMNPIAVSWWEAQIRVRSPASRSSASLRLCRCLVKFPP